MAQTTLSIRIDENLKKQLERLCSDFGMNISTAITVFAKAVVRQQRIPFEIESSEPHYNEITKQAIADVDAGRNLRGPFQSVEALMEDLNA